MGFLAELIAPPPARASGNPTDARYWSPVYATLSQTGIHVTPEIAFMCSCLYQGVRLIAQTVASLPIKIYRETGPDTKELARENPLWPILRRRPNSWQTPTEFIRVMTAHKILWSNAFAEIVPGPRGAVEELIPLMPDTVSVEPLPRRRRRYIVQEPNGTARTLVQEQVFHLRGFGLDTVLPTPLLRLAREAIGLWLALEQFESTFFREGARPGLVLEHPKTLTPEAHGRLTSSLAERVTGLLNMHRPFVAEEGMKVSQYGFNLRDSQATEARAFMVAEVARWLNLPEYKLGGTKQPTFASVEQFARDYVDTTIVPETTDWEQRIEADLLVVDADQCFVKFVLDALLRGSTLDRANAYAIFVQNGIFTANEIRAMEDRNPLPGGNELVRQLNTAPTRAMPATAEQVGALGGLIRAGYDPAASLSAVGMGPIRHTGVLPVTVQPEDATSNGGPPNPSPPPTRPSQTAPALPSPDVAEPDEDNAESARAPRKLVLLARSSAARVWRKESAAIEAHAAKLAGKPDAWAAWVETFYREHAATVAEGLQLEPLLAREYADAHRSLLLSEGVGIVARWEQEAPGELVRLAVGRPAIPAPAPEPEPPPPAPTRPVTTKEIVRDPKTRLALRTIETTEEVPV